MKLSIPRFDGAHVLVVGDVMLDRYWHGSTGRISPEAPVPVVKVTHTEDRPGGAANVAINIAALGARVALAGVVGKDEPAEILRQRLGAAGVACSFTVSPTLPTITKLRVISRHQQLLRMDFEDAPSSDIEAAALLRDSAAQLSGVQVMVLSDYAKGALSDPAALIAIARKAGVPVLVDPKGAEFSRYRGATLLTPNLHEFETVVGHCATEHDLVERGLALLQTLHIDALLITRGEQGMTLLRTGERELHLPARAREVYDVTGAGDTVIAVLAAALAAGESLPQAVALANLGASIVVGKLGTASVSAPELRRAVLGEHNTARGVMTEEQLAIAVSDAREHGERIVFTNGCFDILHAGHVTYLQEAAQLGDRLVVAVNNDDSVKRLKGEGRPINPVESRMAVLAGLESVAWVVSFADDTPERLLEILRPDVLVKGGDYKVDQVVGASIVRTHGGEVKVLGVVDNHSTTAIVDKIKSGRQE